jgi:hypothetical protein
MMLLGLIPSAIAARKGHNAFLRWLYGSLLFVIALPHSLLVTPPVKVDADAEPLLHQSLNPKHKSCPRCDATVTNAMVLCQSCSYPLHYRPQSDGWADPHLSSSEEPGEGRKCGVGDVMLDSFGIRFRGFRGDTDGEQKIYDDAVPGPDAGGEVFTGLGQENAAIGFCHGQSLPLQAADRLDGGGVSHAETPRDIGRPRLSTVREKVGDQLDIVLQQRTGLGRARLSEAAGLGRLFGHR